MHNLRVKVLLHRMHSILRRVMNLRGRYRRCRRRWWIRVVGGMKTVSCYLPMLRLLDCRIQIPLLGQILRVVVVVPAVGGGGGGSTVVVRLLFGEARGRVRRGSHFQPPRILGWLRGRMTLHHPLLKLLLLLLLRTHRIPQGELLLSWVVGIHMHRQQGQFQVFLLQDCIRCALHTRGVVCDGR